MRTLRSITATFITVMMIALMVFMPGSLCKVNAAGSTVEVSTADAFVSAVKNSSNRNNIIKLTGTITLSSSCKITVPVTLNLNGNSLILNQGCNIQIDTANDSDTVTITGSGWISGNVNGSVISLSKGHLIFDSGTMFNDDLDNGTCFSDSSNITLIEGIFYCSKPLGSHIKIDPISISEWRPSWNEARVRPGLKICGKNATSANCSDILGDGIFSYDPSSKTLTINGSQGYDGTESVISSYIDGLTVKIAKTASLQGTFQFYRNTTITGNGKLTLTCRSDYNAIEMIQGEDVPYDLTIKDITMEINGDIGFLSIGDNHLIIDGADLTVNANRYFNDGFTELSLKDCSVVKPGGSQIIEGKLYNSDGTTPATSVEIQTLSPWGQVEYSWSSDYSTCTAKRVNRKDSSQTVTETVKSTSKVKKVPTEYIKGTTTYTAVFTNNLFETQTIDVQNIPVISSGDNKEVSFEDFVERLYVIALERPSEPEGKAFWCEKVNDGTYDGAYCARFFLTSPEFLGKNKTDGEFVDTLYRTFFGREADDEGRAFWISKIRQTSKESVIEGFINSEEWCNICATYGVRSGAQWAKATIASKNATAFATRLYTECLGRDPEQDGLNFWSLSLTNQERTGTQAAKEFFYSPEFLGKNLSNDDYVERLYRTFMGRPSETEGKAHWLKQLNSGAMNRDQVFDFFSTCEEFTGICQQYAIQR